MGAAGPGNNSGWRTTGMCECGLLLPPLPAVVIFSMPPVQRAPTRTLRPDSYSRCYWLWG